MLPSQYPAFENVYKCTAHPIIFLKFEFIVSFNDSVINHLISNIEYFHISHLYTIAVQIGFSLKEI